MRSPRTLSAVTILAVLIGALVVAGGAYAITEKITEGCVRPFCTTREASVPDGQQVIGANPLATFPSSLAGTWTGTIRQSDTKRWTLELRIEADQHVGSVRYPDLNCAGTLTLTSVTAET